MRCLAACFDGTTSSYHDQDTSYPCAMCAPFGGKGTMPGATVAEWMRDAGYRAYCARTFSAERVSYPRWSAQAAARDARDAQRRDAQRAAEAAEAAEAAGAAQARIAQRRRSSGAESGASWSALTSQGPRPPPAAPQAAPLSASGVPGAGETEALCVICYEREQTHLFNMCGHLGFCGPCVATRSECPICRTPGRAIKVFRVTSFGKRANRARSAR
jgi:hypothetical protein